MHMHGRLWEEEVAPNELRRRRNEFCKRWKMGLVTQEKCRVVVWSCRDRLRRAKADIELNPVRNVKRNKRFYKPLSSKTETGANMVPLLNGHGELVKNDMEKAKALRAAFTSGFASKMRLHESLAPKNHGKVQSFLSLLFFLICPYGATFSVSHPWPFFLPELQTTVCSNQI